MFLHLLCLLYLWPLTHFLFLYLDGTYYLSNLVPLATLLFLSLLHISFTLNERTLHYFVFTPLSTSQFCWTLPAHLVQFTAPSYGPIYYLLSLPPVLEHWRVYPCQLLICVFKFSQLLSCPCLFLSAVFPGPS